MGSNLFQIQNEFLQLSEALIENGGEITPEIETALRINKDELQTKGQGYGMVIKSLYYNCDIIDMEIKRLQAIKKSSVSTAERLEQSLSTAMKVYDIEKIETPLLKISFRKSESVEIINMDQLDQKYMVEKVTVTPDKKAIKEAINKGEFVEGAILQVNQNLQIK